MPTAPTNLPEFAPVSAVLTTPPGEPGGDVTLTWDNVDEWTGGAGITVNLIDPEPGAGPTYELTNPADPTAPFTLALTSAGNPFYAEALATNGYQLGAQTFPQGSVSDAAQAIADDLTASTFSLGFTAQATHHPDFDIKAGDLDATTVMVAPAVYNITGESRGALDERHFIDVGVFRKFTQAPTILTTKQHRENEARSLTSLVQEIVQDLINKTISVSATMKIVGLGVEVVHIAQADHWERDGVFASVSRFQFKANRAR